MARFVTSGLKSTRNYVSNLQERTLSCQPAISTKITKGYVLLVPKKMHLTFFTFLIYVQRLFPRIIPERLNQLTCKYDKTIKFNFLFKIYKCILIPNICHSWKFKSTLGKNCPQLAFNIPDQSNYNLCLVHFVHNEFPVSFNLLFDTFWRISISSTLISEAQK